MGDSLAAIADVEEVAAELVRQSAELRDQVGEFLQARLVDAAAWARRDDVIEDREYVRRIHRPAPFGLELVERQPAIRLGQGQPVDEQERIAFAEIGDLMAVPKLGIKCPGRCGHMHFLWRANADACWRGGNELRSVEFTLA